MAQARAQDVSEVLDSSLCPILVKNHFLKPNRSTYMLFLRGFSRLIRAKLWSDVMKNLQMHSRFSRSFAKML